MPNGGENVIRTGVVGALNDEWDRLVDAGGVPAVDGTELDGCADVGAVLDAIRADPDACLLALLRATRSGEALAARVVLQALLPKVVLMAARDRGATVADYLAALWVVIATYPADRRPGRVAANLTLDTLKQVSAERARGRRWERDAATDPSWRQVRAGVEAERMLHTAVELELVDTATGTLLHDVYLQGFSSRDAARRHGGTAAMVRYRCSRAVRRLADHATLLAAA